MKTLAIALATFWLLLASANAQMVQIDSLAKLLPTAPTDTAKARLWYHMSSHWARINPDTALFLADKSYKLFAKHHYKHGMGEALLQKANIKSSVNQLSQAITLYKEAQNIFVTIGDSRGEASSLSGLGVIYGREENYDQALSYFLRALKIYESINYEKGMATSYLRIGIVYIRTNHPEDGLKYNVKALQLALKSGDNSTAATIYNNIGSLYGQMNMLKESRTNLLLSKQLAEQGNIWPVAAEAYLNLGNVYRELEQYDSSAFYFAKAEKHFIQFKSNEGLSKTYDGWAELLMVQNKFEAAKQHINKSIAIAESINSKAMLYNNYELLLSISKAEKNNRSALMYAEQLLALKDSMYLIEKAGTIERLQSNYMHEKDELIIDQLKEENELRTRQRNILLIVTVIGLILSLALITSIGYIYKKNVQIRKREEDLVELNLMKDKFLSVLSHDLRTPLANILQLLNLVSEDDKSQEHKSIFDKLKVTTSSVLETMDNMLAWSKNSLTKSFANKKEVKLNEITSRVCRFLEQTASNKNIQIQNKICQTIVLTADENQLEFVLRNLVSNAVKFSHDNSRVEISAVENDNEVKIHVIDYGTGMDKEQQSKLFNIQDRESTKGTAGETGSGLGLVLSHEFITLHQGNIQVNSKAGKGTEFIVTLPVKNEAI